MGEFDKFVSLRMSEKLHHSVFVAARKAKMGISEWLRMAAIEKLLNDKRSKR